VPLYLYLTILLSLHCLVHETLRDKLRDVVHSTIEQATAKRGGTGDYGNIIRSGQG
jgi:hypothetical protein